MRFDAYRLVGTLVLLALMLAPLTAGAQTASDRVTEEKVEAAWIQLQALITEEMKKTGVPGIAIAIVYRAGGASSSARDMAQWMRLYLGGGKVDGKQIIVADALAETYRPQMVSNPVRDPATDCTGFYGLGWNVNYDELGRVKLSHSGAFDLGAASTVYLLPAEQLGIVILTNAAPIGVEGRG